MQIFQGLHFIFPLPTLNLTKNRISTLASLIQQNGGIIDYSYTGESFIIVGNDAKIELCQNYLNITDKDRDKIIKAEWISQSLLKKQLLNYIEFQLEVKKTELQSEIPFQKPKPIYSDTLNKILPPIIQEPDSEPYQQIKDLDLPQQRSNFVSEMMREYRQYLNYEYDNQLENYHDEIDDDYDENDQQFVLEEALLKKEEYIDPQQSPGTKFYGDDECMITDVRTPFQTLFDGIDVKVPFNVDTPICSALLKQTQQFNPGLKRKAQFWEPKKGYFVCESGDAHKSFNNQIIEELDKLLKIYTNDKDKGRCIAYRKAIGFIKSLKFPIRSEEDITEMPTIGSKIKKKIVEIIQTGKLKKVENLQGLERNVVVDQLTRVWGIGPTTAMSFYFKGIKTIEDLKQHSYLLNRMQLIGLQYVEELEQRIPRDEATQIYMKVKQCIDELSDVIDIYEAIPCGSYRRGKDNCGDVDILITRKDGKDSSGLLGKLIHILEKDLLTDHLVLPKIGSNGSESYMGICRLQQDGIHRRIDLKYYPREQYGCAVLYFTGSDHFNRSMRLFAQKKGYSLSDHGVYPTLRAQHNKKVWKGELIPCCTEKEVFQLLGLTYRKPEDRSV